MKQEVDWEQAWINCAKVFMELGSSSEELLIQINRMIERIRKEFPNEDK